MAKKTVTRKRTAADSPPEPPDALTPLEDSPALTVAEAEPDMTNLSTDAPMPDVVSPPAPAAAQKSATALLPRLAVPPLLEKEWQAFTVVGVASALIGALFALLILAAINRGTLSLNQREEVAALTNRADELASRADAVETESESLRARLAALEGLTGRVDAAESALADMSTALDSAQADLAALNTRADQLAADVEKIRAASQRFDSFLHGLRALLDDVQAAPTATPETQP